jgi:tetratricopeptide (TPR) repeat protein
MRPAAAMPEDMPDDGAAPAAAKPAFTKIAIADDDESSDDDDDWIVVHKLGLSKEEDRDYAAAEALLRRALALVEKQLPDSASVSLALCSLAGLLHNKFRDYAAAEPLFRKALAIREKRLGPEHAHVASTLTALAQMLQSKGDLAAAEPLFRKALAIREKLLGTEHEHIAASLDDLALCLWKKANLAAAEPLLMLRYSAASEPLYRRSLAIREKQLEPDHPRVGDSVHRLAALLKAKGDHSAAVPLYRRVLAIRETQYRHRPRPFPIFHWLKRCLAICLKKAGAAVADAPPAPKRQKRSEESDGATEDDCVITGARSAEDRDAELLRNAISVADDSDAEADAPKALGEGAQPTCAGTLEDQLAKLRDGLEGDGFDVSVALTWCEENGADKLYEIVEAKMVDEFVASLALKPVKANVLKERLRAFVAAGGD